MKLNEWKDSTGQKVSASNSGIAIKFAGSFKNRFSKLIKYHEQHLPVGCDHTKVNKLSDDTLEFTDYYDDSDFTIIEHKIYIGSATEAWRLQVDTRPGTKDDLSGMGWPELLRNLRVYITVPVTTTPDYKNLLTEWLDSQGKKVGLNNSSAPVSNKTSSKSNKEKFTHLLYYIMRNRGSRVVDSKVVKLDDQGFTYREQRTNPAKKYDLTIVVNFNNTSWQISFYQNGIFTGNLSGEGWEEFLETLRDYYNVPAAGTKEYKDLCEAISSIAEDFKTYENLWD